MFRLTKNLFAGLPTTLRIFVLVDFLVLGSNTLTWSAVRSLDFRFRPITLVLVNRKLFNDTKLGIADTPKYQALKGLAFAYSDREDEELKYKLGFHFCPVQIQNKPCKELAEKFSKLPGIDFY